MKSEKLKVKSEAAVARVGGHPSKWIVAFFTFHFSLFTFHSDLRAQPTQEEVFRSIQDNVRESPADSGRMLGILAGAAGLLVLFVVVAQRRQKGVAAPRALEHHGKLVREIMKTVPLKPAELKQLKLLAEQGETVESPLTLLLCPSVLLKSLQQHPARIDRKVVIGVARKLGVR